MWHGPEGRSGNFPEEKKQHYIQVKNVRPENTELNYQNNDSYYWDNLLLTYHDELAELEYLGKFIAHTAGGQRERGWVNITTNFPTTPVKVCNCHMCTCPSGVWLWPESSGRWRSQTPPHWGASGWSCCSDTDSHWCDSLPQCRWWMWASASATPASGSIHKQEHSEPYTVTKSWLEEKPWNDAHLHQDHVELCNVNPLLL